MKNKVSTLLLVFCLAVGALMGQPVSCPPLQHDTGAQACEWNNTLDTVAFLTAQNAAVANSLNNAPPQVQAVQAMFWNLPLNQQTAIQVCEVAVSNNQYLPNLFPTIPASCPLAGPGMLDVAALLAATPAPTNPGNMPSVKYNSATGQFTPAVPPAPGPAVPIIIPAPAPITPGSPVCGPFWFDNTYGPGPGAYTSLAKTAASVPDGTHVAQGSQSFTVHVQHTQFGLQVSCTTP